MPDARIVREARANRVSQVTVIGLAGDGCNVYRRLMPALAEKREAGEE